MSQIILLTGATGFVGRQVLNALHRNSAKLRLIVREGKQGQFLVGGQIEKILVTADLFLEPQSWWENACEGVDTVIHVAWYVEPGKYLHSPRNLDCLSGTLALAKACEKAGVRRFVGVGTCSEYDMELGFLSPLSPLKPLTSYAATKAAAFIALSQFFETAGIEFAWCRLFYLYGEGEDERRLVPYIRLRLAAGKIAKLSSGKQIRDFMDVQQAGKLIFDVARGIHVGPVNICSEIPITLRAFAEKIADEYDRRDLLRFGARPDSPFDPLCVVGVR